MPKKPSKTYVPKTGTEEARKNMEEIGEYLDIPTGPYDMEELNQPKNDREFAEQFATKRSPRSFMDRLISPPTKKRK